MSRAMRYGPLKVSGTITAIEAAAAGPYAIGGSATVYVAPVPCKGARQVVWRVTGAGGGLANTTTVWMANQPDGTNAFNSGSAEVTPVGEQAGGISSSGGASIGVVASLANARLQHDWAYLVLTNDANAKSNVVVTAEVWYDLEASIVMAEVGQAGAAAFTY